VAKGGHQHQLVIYQIVLDRWWKATLSTSVSLLVLAAGLFFLPILIPEYQLIKVSDLNLWVITGAGGFSFMISLFLIVLRKKAYVQPYENHLRLVTPFLRLNISYQRIQRTYTAEVQQLYPTNRSTRWQRELLRPISNWTVVILDLAGFPIPRSTLKFFLSPTFFPDNTPKLALLVSDWIDFSTELESRRGSFKDSRRYSPEEQPRSRLLSEITRKKK
jgi:hypothetical protein